MMTRTERLQASTDTIFDVLIVGGGVTGAGLYHRLCREGYKVLLIDKADIGGGTSQTSAMMVWGGLLYLKNLDIINVFRLCRARDRLIRDLGHLVRTSTFRYLPRRRGGRAAAFVMAGLRFYWMLAMGRRALPSRQANFPERSFLRTEAFKPSLLYEEGMLRVSDCRFALQWILRHQNDAQAAITHCRLEDCEYCAPERLWHCRLRDRQGGNDLAVRARCIVNCAGIWADRVNAAHGISSPWKHVLSKGVSFACARPELHEKPLIFETGEHGDCQLFTPWGPVSLWGPTETYIEDLEEGLQPDEQDLRFLLDHASKNLRLNLRPEDIVSLRCGVRPLAVKRSFDRKCYPLELSRRYKACKDPDKPWISVYGGKLSSCLLFAGTIARSVWKCLGPAGETPIPKTQPPEVRHATFPAVSGPVPSAEYCRDHELCLTLEDYLRRRTNIAQWVPRCGLGRNNEHLAAIRAIAGDLFPHDADMAAKQVADYQATVAEQFDRPIGRL